MECLLSFGAESFVLQFAIQKFKIKIYRTIVFPVVLYGCENWSLAMKEELRPRVFENRTLRRIFGSKKDVVKREWGKLHTEEVNDVHCSPNIFRIIKSRRMRWTGCVALMGERRGVYRILVGKPEGKKLLGSPRRRWEDSIKMDL
jgi:hypothetical protein